MTGRQPLAKRLVGETAERRDRLEGRPVCPEVSGALSSGAFGEGPLWAPRPRWRDVRLPERSGGRWLGAPVSWPRRPPWAVAEPGVTDGALSSSRLVSRLTHEGLGTGTRFRISLQLRAHFLPFNAPKATSFRGTPGPPTCGQAARSPWWRKDTSACGQSGRAHSPTCPDTR